MNGKGSIFRAYHAPEVSICEICAERGFAESPTGTTQTLTQSYWGESEETEY